MPVEAKTFTWTDVLSTPLGPVSCNLRSSLPLVPGTDDLSRVSGGLLIRLESFDLPTNWNQGFYPDPLQIDGGRCWRWFFECVSENIARVDLHCGLDDISAAFWDAATGENLAAVEYKLSGSTLHIGTEDDQLLYGRTTYPEGGFPMRFKDELGLPSPFSQQLIELDRSGVNIHIPQLLIGEILYFHLLAAHVVDEQEGDSWLAVDRSKKDLDGWLLSASSQ